MDDDERNGIARLQMTKQLYATGDDQAFGDFIDAEFQRTKLDSELLKMIRTSLLYERNLDMAQEIDRLLNTETDRKFFFSVGIGHLVGDRTVQDELRRRGYTVTRVASEQPSHAADTPE